MDIDYKSVETPYTTSILSPLLLYDTEGGSGRIGVSLVSPDFGFSVKGKHQNSTSSFSIDLGLYLKCPYLV